MSMYRCDGCSKLIDTDDDPDCFDSEGQGFCEPCRDKHWCAGQDMARDYHLTEMASRGCSCQWVGANGDPDQHIKRDRNCPLHGIDPDAAREARNDHVAEPFRSILNSFARSGS